MLQGTVNYHNLSASYFFPLAFTYHYFPAEHVELDQKLCNLAPFALMQAMGSKKF
jgi:hypothetical protein